MKHSDIKNGMKVEVVNVLSKGCHPKGTVGTVRDKTSRDFRVAVKPGEKANWYTAKEVRRPSKSKVVSKTKHNKQSPKRRSNKKK